MMKKKTLIAGLLSAALFSLSAVSFAAPQGKPFVEINGQIVDLQNDVASLEAELQEFKDDVYSRFSTLESRVSAIDGKIADLVARDASIMTQIQSLVASVESNTDLLNNLLATINDLTTRIDDLELETATLKQDTQNNLSAIQSNEETIAQLNSELDAAYDSLSAQVEGVASLLAQKVDTSEFISALFQLKYDLEQELALKQNIINASCGEGEAISNISPDGSFSCTSPGLSIGNVGLVRTTIYGDWVTANPATTIVIGYTQESYVCGYSWTGGTQYCTRQVPVFGTTPTYTTARVSCPTGAIKTSGSHTIISPAQYSGFGAYGEEGVYVTVRNNSTTAGQVRAIVTCLGIGQI